MPTIAKISPCLWFDDRAEEAAEFYVSIFDNSSIGSITRYGKEGFEVHGQPEGRVLTVSFTLDGHDFTALNGGPHFTFNEAVSFVVRCKDQAEVDRYWEALSAEGDPAARQCGWLKDRFGLSWQIVPAELYEMLTAGDAAASDRVMKAVLGMKKLDLAALREAYEAA